MVGPQTDAPSENELLRPVDGWDICMIELRLYLEARSKHGLSRTAAGSIQTWVTTRQLSVENRKR